MSEVFMFMALRANLDLIEIVCEELLMEWAYPSPTFLKAMRL
jgi:hypothetical protein